MKKLIKNGNSYYYGSIFNKRIVINVKIGIIIIESNKKYTFFDPMWIEGSIAEAENEERGVLLLAEYLYDNN